MSELIKNMITKALEPIKRRVLLTVGRAVITLVNDSLKLQTNQVSLLAGELRDLERFQEYGFTSVPLPGAEAIAVFVGGNRENGAVIATCDRNTRLKDLNPGEVALYDYLGNFIKLKAGGEINVKSTTKVVVESGKAEVKCNFAELGKGTLEKVLNGETFQTLFNAHVHNGNLGIPTGPPVTPSGPNDLSQAVSAAKLPM